MTNDGPVDDSELCLLDAGGAGTHSGRARGRVAMVDGRAAHATHASAGAAVGRRRAGVMEDLGRSADAERVAVVPADARHPAEHVLESAAEPALGAVHAVTAR